MKRTGSCNRKIPLAVRKSSLYGIKNPGNKDFVQCGPFSSIYAPGGEAANMLGVCSTGEKLNFNWLLASTPFTDVVIRLQRGRRLSASNRLSRVLNPHPSDPKYALTTCLSFAIFKLFDSKQNCFHLLPNAIQVGTNAFINRYGNDLRHTPLWIPFEMNKLERINVVRDDFPLAWGSVLKSANGVSINENWMLENDVVNAIKRWEERFKTEDEQELKTLKEMGELEADQNLLLHKMQQKNLELQIIRKKKERARHMLDMFKSEIKIGQKSSMPHAMPSTSSPCLNGKEDTQHKPINGENDSNVDNSIIEDIESNQIIETLSMKYRNRDEDLVNLSAIPDPGPQQSLLDEHSPDDDDNDASEIDSSTDALPYQHNVVLTNLEISKQVMLTWYSICPSREEVTFCCNFLIYAASHHPLFNGTECLRTFSVGIVQQVKSAWMGTLHITCPTLETAEQVLSLIKDSYDKEVMEQEQNKEEADRNMLNILFANGIVFQQGYVGFPNSLAIVTCDSYVSDFNSAISNPYEKPESVNLLHQQQQLQQQQDIIQEPTVEFEVEDDDITTDSVSDSNATTKDQVVHESLQNEESESLELRKYASGGNNEKKDKERLFCLKNQITPLTSTLSSSNTNELNEYHEEELFQEVKSCYQHIMNVAMMEQDEVDLTWIFITQSKEDLVTCLDGLTRAAFQHPIYKGNKTLQGLCKLIIVKSCKYGWSGIWNNSVGQEVLNAIVTLYKQASPNLEYYLGVNAERIKQVFLAGHVFQRGFLPSRSIM
ncbi:unnamed protein product [Orchesella dallaii]|uniref:Uncharacterized protein n=1 Tax=Orchesella dallaii TaxID=48710 RepID=A0ABP1S0P8_9HEXA